MDQCHQTRTEKTPTTPMARDFWPWGGATEELLSTRLLGSLARGQFRAQGGLAARVQRYQAPPAADPTGNAAIGRSRRGAARQLRHLGTSAADINGRTVGHSTCYCGAAWYYATRQHRLLTSQGTRALVEPWELRAGACTSRRHGLWTRMDQLVVRAGGAA
jgi:hypothetical protein